MGQVNFGVSEVAVLETIAVGVLILALLQALHLGHRRLDKRWRQRLPVARLLPVLEVTVGLLYVVWALEAVLQGGVYHDVAMFMAFAVIVLLLGWFAARDWVAGIVLKVENAYDAGQHLRLGEVEGTILTVGPLSLEVESSQGERIRIPYSRLSGEIRGLRSGDAPREHYRFQIDVHDCVDAAAATRRLREAILNSPWSPPDREPRIRVLTQTASHVGLEAVVFAPEAVQAGALEMDVRHTVGAAADQSGQDKENALS